MANLTTNDTNKFRVQIDAMYVAYELHQETLEFQSPQYWKIQDIKCKLAELMEVM